MAVIIHKELSYAVKGACFDVHNALGPMLPEKFYQAAMAIANDVVLTAAEARAAYQIYRDEAALNDLDGAIHAHFPQGTGAFTGRRPPAGRGGSVWRRYSSQYMVEPAWGWCGYTGDFQAVIERI